MELQQTTAIITGSTGKLGSRIAMGLAAWGCDCICHYHKNKTQVEQLVSKIEAAGTKAVAVQADLTSDQQIKKLFEQHNGLSPVRILINCASMFSKQLLDETDSEQANKMINLNLTAPILISRQFSQGLAAQLDIADKVIGKIINISDVGGIRPWAGYTVYCASKAGLNGATKALAKELAPAVCVNAIAIGIVDFENQFDEQQRKRQLSFIPMRRFAEPREVVSAVKFLIESDYITGQVLNICGGRCI